MTGAKISAEPDGSSFSEFDSINFPVDDSYLSISLNREMECGLRGQQSGVDAPYRASLVMRFAR